MNGQNKTNGLNNNLNSDNNIINLILKKKTTKFIIFFGVLPIVLFILLFVILLVALATFSPLSQLLDFEVNKVPTSKYSYGCTNCVAITTSSVFYDNSFSKNDFVSMVNSLEVPSGVGGSGKTTSWGYNTFFKPNAENFFDIATSYNVDPRFIFSIGILESYYGTSNIAVDKGNFFGYMAYDDSPYDSAQTFARMSEGIEAVSELISKYAKTGTWYNNAIISRGYDPTTIEGVGSLYASDPGWAKKVKNIMKNIFGYIENNNSYTGNGSITLTSGDGYKNVYTSSFNKMYKEFKQNSSDASYKDLMYGSRSIARQGCSITAIAIVLSGYGYDVTPANWAGNNLISVSGVLDSYVGATLHYASSNINSSKQQIQNNLKQGRPVVIHVLAASSFTDNEHWMALLDISSDGSQVYLSNPNVSGQNGWVNIDDALYDLNSYVLISGGKNV